MLRYVNPAQTVLHLYPPCGQLEQVVRDDVQLCVQVVHGRYKFSMHVFQPPSGIQAKTVPLRAFQIRPEIDRGFEG